MLTPTGGPSTISPLSAVSTAGKTSLVPVLYSFRTRIASELGPGGIDGMSPHQLKTYQIGQFQPNPLGSS